MLNFTPARESGEELNNGGSDNFEVQCDLCDKACISERKLKVHKAKWHTKVSPLYRNIIRQLGFREKFNTECLIYGKQLNDSEQHIREDPDFIDEEAIKKILHTGDKASLDRCG